MTEITERTVRTGPDTNPDATPDTKPDTVPLDGAGALAAIRGWHAEARLVERYPQVLALLPGLDAAARGSVGQLLARLDAEEVLRLHPQTPALTVAITGHSTLAGLVAPLTAELARHGLMLRHRLSDYDGWVRDLGDPKSEVYQDGTDLVLCVLDAETVFDDLPVPWRVEDAEAALTARLRLLDSLAGTYAAHGTGTLVLNTLPLLPRFLRRLVDLRSRTRLCIAWREFNAGLLRLGETHPNVLAVDLDPLLAAGGPAADPRLSSYAKARLSDETLAGYAVEIGHLARALTGRTKKVLVLDADGTLWDGILGDDGPEGIAAAGSFRGEAFGEFQKVIKQIGAQGVLLAVCSKNDLEPVLSVVRDHPDMVLREDDFVHITANWRPKDGNLLALAERLNLGADSFVFADDNPFECGLVRTSVPGAAVIGLDDEPALHIDKLLADGWFDVREVTDADRGRGAQYRSDAARRDLQEASGSAEEYLTNLGVTVTFSAPAPLEIARVSQLTQRTNQFNLTTVRLRPEQVREQLADPGRLVLAIRSADRFGDNGLVGAVFAHHADDGLHLDNILLSCRVFARGIEQACLAALLEAARATGVPAVHGTYRPTKKNHRMRAFYPDHGFATFGGDEDELRFRHDLTTIAPAPAHVDLTADLTGAFH
ncbi:HAD-IIIC family phosphatase [Streptomyces sp. NPDC052101]|uniref:HAD-IIIC family phosphatase n=1 Tax=Streptomyces sp. NPDC052101 TaxID=3155763 RepID=UPI00342EBC19